MSTYESDPAGLGVGKRFGPLFLGGVAGVSNGDSGQFVHVAEVTAEELSANSSISFKIPEGNALITGVWVEVDEAFPTANDHVDVLYNGSTVLDADIDVDATGVFEGVTTIIGSTAVTSANAITIDVTGIAGTPAAGSCKVITEFKRV